MLRRMCRLMGARPCVTLENRMEDLGFVTAVYTKEIGDKVVTIMEQDKDSAACISTIVLRGATDNQMNDMERACEDVVADLYAAHASGKKKTGVNVSGEKGEIGDMTQF